MEPQASEGPPGDILPVVLKSSDAVYVIARFMTLDGCDLFADLDPKEVQPTERVV
jgi:hypothetical protein